MIKKLIVLLLLTFLVGCASSESSSSVFDAREDGVGLFFQL